MANNYFNTSRRDFLKATGLSVPLFGISGLSLISCTNKKVASPDELFSYFSNPSSEAKPFFRWWWNGNHLTKEEISREIQVMKQAGAGGVEINPIAMPQQIASPPKDGLIWLSDAWCEMVTYTVEAAKRNNMVVDLIVGTGWPFGAEFLETDQTIQGLTTENHLLRGPGRKSITLQETSGKEEILKIYQMPTDLQQIDDTMEVDQRPDPNNQLFINLSHIENQLVIIRVKKGFREVYRGAPGGAGPVLDHFNAEAVSRYLNQVSDKLNPYFNGKLGNGIRAIFCDSIELEGANWTSDFPEEFEKRRGYTIYPYLPVLMSDMMVDPVLVDTIERARYDYSLTLAELFRERFIEVFHQWCHKNQVLSRYQAYGHPWLYTDLVDGYMIPDIPEGDQWLFNPGWSYSNIKNIRYAIWNKYASSGGHLTNRTIISSEAMTNTSGVFKATLKYQKQAADLNFIAGINHLVLHGFNYSPPAIDFPGWIQYGTYYHEKNTWWPYMMKFMEYTSRISMVLQKSLPVSQVAILGPTADIWRKHGLNRNPFNTEPWYLHSIWQAFSSHGISCDYINGHILTGATFQNGNLNFNKMSYQALVVCNVDSLEMPVARSILQYVESGGKVIFISQLPSKSPGMKNNKEFDKLVRSSTERAIESGAKVDKGPEFFNQDIMNQMVNWAGEFISKYHLIPDIHIANPDAYLMSAQFIHRHKPVLFFANVHESRETKSDISFSGGGFDFWRWDPENFTRTQLYINDNGSISLNLKPLESALLVLDHTRNALPTPHANTGKEWVLEGEWQLECVPKIEGEKIEKNIDRLVDLSTLPDLVDFSGSIIYRKSFVLQETDFQHLTLGVVHDLAEVRINRKKIGVDWYGNKIFELNGCLVKGRNELEIRVVNSLLNYCISQRKNPEIGYWLDRYRENAKILPAGLIGPVKLTG